MKKKVLLLFNWQFISARLFCTPFAIMSFQLFLVETNVAAKFPISCFGSSGAVQCMNRADSSDWQMSKGKALQRILNIVLLTHIPYKVKNGGTRL